MTCEHSIAQLHCGKLSSSCVKSIFITFYFVLWSPASQKLHFLLILSPPLLSRRGAGYICLRSWLRTPWQDHVHLQTAWRSVPKHRLLTRRQRCFWQVNCNDSCKCVMPSTLVCSSAHSSLCSLCLHSCNGKNSCSIQASNSVFGDPCPGTYKYLELAYVCECK